MHSQGIQTSDLQDCELINACTVELLCIRYLVTEATGKTKPMQQQGPWQLRQRNSSGQLCCSNTMALSDSAKGSGGWSEEADRSPHTLPSSLWEKCRKDLQKSSEKVKESLPAPPSPHAQPNPPRWPGTQTKLLPGGPKGYYLDSSDTMDTHYFYYVHDLYEFTLQTEFHESIHPCK